MKILHINTFANGGAAGAAIKVHYALLNQGVESKFLSLAGNTAATNIKEAYSSSIKSKNLVQYWKYLISKFHFRLCNIFHPKKEYEIFTVPYSTFDLTAERLVKEADIIHLHWVAGYVDYPTFFKRINKPIVWTLHDMNPFLGGFHYQGDEQLNKSALLKKLDNSIKVHKQKVFEHKENITFICPSGWIKRVSENSNILSHLQHCHIPGAIDPALYAPVDKQLARKELNLPPDSTILTFISDNANIRRKGLEIFKQAICSLKEQKNIQPIVVIKVGHGVCDDIPDLVDMGRINDQEKMSMILSASDAMVLPSLEDNFPNVMLEANACGCPVIGFPVGGIQEFIIPSFNGVLAEEASATALKQAILQFLTEKEIFKATEIRTYIVQNYTTEKQVHSHLQLYRKLTAPVPTPSIPVC